jgi:periplasmic protein TonB
MARNLRIAVQRQALVVAQPATFASCEHPMEFPMLNLKSTNTALFATLVFLSASAVTPAQANWFSSSGSGGSRNVGSAPNPSPLDIRASRTAEAAYPSASRMLHEQGKVKLMISLTEQGTVSDATVESSSGFPRLDNAAVQYMTDNIAYKLAKGERMPKVVPVVVTFQLR